MARERGEPAARTDPGAAFASTRVAGPRRAPRIAVVGFLVAVAGIVGIGVAGRGDDPAGAPPAAAASARDQATGTPATAPATTAAPVRVPGPEMTSAPGLLQLVAQRQLDSVFVHGDVFAADVTWVYLSLKDASGRIAGWASVSAPGGVGSRSEGPTMRFDLQLAAPDANFPGPLELAATAYGSGGKSVASASIEGLKFLFIVPIGAGGPSQPGRDAPALQPAQRPRSDPAGWPPSRSLGDAFVPVAVSTPAAAATVAATEAVAVAGSLRIKAASVRITLQTTSHEVLDEATIDTSDPDGGIRPVQAPTFGAELSIPRPRPIGGRLLVIVTAYDVHGTALGLVRRVVTVAPLGG